MKKIWAIRKDAEAVSPVIATILMVAITVVLAAVLYVMVLGFGQGGGSQTPTSSLTKVTPAPDYGVKYQFAPMSKDTAWTDVSILITDGVTTVSWAPLTTDLDNGTTAKWNGASKVLGIISANCSITDLAGNGYVNQGDFFTITGGPGAAFLTSTTYTVTIMYDPSSAKICDTTFQG